MRIKHTQMQISLLLYKTSFSKMHEYYFINTVHSTREKLELLFIDLLYYYF